MKLKTKFRYVAWDVNGTCHSFDCRPTPATHFPLYGGWISYGDVARESILYNCCPGAWDEVRLDNENEEDVKVLQALLTL